MDYSIIVNWGQKLEESWSVSFTQQECTAVYIIMRDYNDLLLCVSAEDLATEAVKDQAFKKSD